MRKFKTINSKRETARGFTLIEMLMTIFIFTVLMGGVSLLFIEVFNTSKHKSAEIYTIDSARKVLFNFTNEMRSAAYGADGSYPINQAGNSQLIIFSPYGGDGSVQRIRYFLSSTTLYKGITVAAGTPPVYNTATETVWPVLSNVVNGATPVFQYYDGTFAGTSTPLVQPVSVTAITFAQMNLQLLSQSATTNATGTFYMTGGAAVRNLKTNLGN